MKTISRLLAGAVLLLLAHTLLAADLPAKFEPTRDAATTLCLSKTWWLSASRANHH